MPESNELSAQQKKKLKKKLKKENYVALPQVHIKQSEKLVICLGEVPT